MVGNCRRGGGGFSNVGFEKKMDEEMKEDKFMGRCIKRWVSLYKWSFYTKNIFVRKGIKQIL